jgi:hypothetical protein
MTDLQLMQLVNNGSKTSDNSLLTVSYYFDGNKQMGLHFITPRTNFKIWMQLHIPIGEVKELKSDEEAFQYLERKIKTFTNYDVKITKVV